MRQAMGWLKEMFIPGKPFHGFPHEIHEILAVSGRRPRFPRLEHADVSGLLDPPGLQGDAGLPRLADDRHELGELHEAGLDLAAHRQGLVKRDPGQERDIGVERPLVHDRHEFRPEPGDEGGRPRQKHERGDDGHGLALQTPMEERQIGLLCPLHDEALPFRMRFEDHVAECRNRHEGQQEGSDQGDDMGEGQRQEHLPLDPLKGDDRDEGQGDDELAENGRLPDLEDGLEDGRQLASPDPFLRKMPLDVFHLDDGRVDDHPDRDRQASEGHEVGRQAENLHRDEREQHRERQGQDDDERAAEAAEEEIQDKDHEQRPDQQSLGDGMDGPVDDIGALVVGFDAEPERKDI